MKAKRITAAAIIAVILLGILPIGAYAADWGEGDTLEDALSQLKVGFDDTLLDWLVLPNLGVIYQRYTYFMYNNERTGTVDEHPVYCIDPTKGGAHIIVRDVGPNSDGSNTATYIRGEKVGDFRYRSIMSSGYPHQRLESLGLQTKEEAYYATKVALWMYIRGNDPTRLTINPEYGNSDPVALRVREAAIEIYTYGTRGGPTREPKLTLTGKPSATARLDASGEYYEQGIEVAASGWIGTNPDACGEVQLSWGSPPPDGTIVLGSNGEDITSTLGVKMEPGANGYTGRVTIRYPASAIDPETFSPPTLNAEAIVPNNDMYIAYAEAGKDRYQRYLVEADPKIEMAASFASQINWEPGDTDFPPDSGLRIRKVQAGTNIPLEGAVFEIRDPDGKLIYSLATGENGIIDIPLYTAGNYTVTEVTPPQYHRLSEIRTQSVYVRYGEVAEVTFTNEPYGTLRVVKRDASNGMPLGGAAVRIRNITTNATQEMYTDSSGSAVFELLPVGAYEILEITAPDGYALDSTVHTVHVVPLSEGETSYALTNKANPGLRITKFDLQTMTPIAGVTFEVWHDGELYGMFVTDSWGEIELRNIPAGTYTAREVATVSPYVLDPTAQWIEIRAGQGYISELIFFNLSKPGIHLVKIDSETFLPLPNARFLIKHVGGPYAKEFTTDLNGEIDLSELEPGAYTVQEVTAPDGYLMDDAIRTIQINPGENAQFVFTNTLKPVLEVLKFDGTRYLPGATFRIAQIADGSHYLDRVTDANGRIRIEGLEPGIYSVQEMDAPTDYVLNDYEFHVELFPGRTSQLVVNNVKKPDLCIIKTDANTGLPIEGVTYTVRKVDSATVSTVKTDANGEAWLYALDPGVYQVTEQSVPPGYLLDPIPQLITLFGGRTGVVRFQNDPRPRLRILKVDVVTGEPLPLAEFRVSKVEGLTVSEYITDASGMIVIENLDEAIYEVTEFMPPDGYIRYDESKQIQLEPGKTKTLKFDNIRKPTLIITKTNAMTFEPIPNTTYKVEHEAPDGGVHTLGTYRTDANGQVVLPKAEPGWYIITETVPAPGFSLPSNPVTRKYLAPGENAYTNFQAGGAGGDTSGDNISITSGYDYLLGHEILDYPLNSIVIRKVDANTGELLAGAAFTVRQVSEDVSGSSGTLIGRYTTDNSGTIVITGLVPGGYIVEEVQAPANYLLSENAQQQVWLKPDGTSIVEATFANFPYGGILITKVDAQTNMPLANARFRVTDSSGAVVGNSNGEYTTDENGEALVPNVKPGSYVITEVEAPAHYAIDTTPQTVKVGVDGGVYKVSFKNQPTGALVLRKLDSVTREPLAGAAFKVTTSGGNVVGTGNGIYRTDATGTITIPHLPKGSYVVQEVEAPEGYILENQSQTIEVDYGKSYTLDFYNRKKSGVQIIKIDGVTKQPLKGAKFTVYRMDGGIVGTYETNGDGVIILDALEPGWYKAAETQAPDGYLIDDTPQDFQVTANQFIKLVFENVPMPGLQIIKLNSATRQPIEGVEFAVTKMNGERIGVYKTDKSGIIVVTALEPGWYTVSEVKAADGYILDAEPQNVEIARGETATLEITNTPMSGLLIVKTDEATGKPLAGVVFDVRRTDGQFVAGDILDGNQPGTEANSPNKTTSPNGDITGSYTTDANGRILINTLPAGEYHVIERKALDGYELDTDVHAATVTPGKLTTLQLTNRQKAGLRLVKIDSITKKPIYNVEFMVFDANGVVVGTFYTDNNGVIDFVGILPQGRYTIRETRAAKGYYLDEIPRTVEFVSGKVTEIRWENTPQMAQIQILKKSGDDNEVNGLPAGAPLEGAVFEVYEHKSGNLVDRFVSGADGRAVSNPLPLGRYVIKEVLAPQWYKLSTQTLDIELEFATQIVKLEFLNYSANTGVTIRKTGPAECMPGDVIRYDIRLVQNNSTVPLTDFYWRDTISTDAVRLTKIVTGTFNQSLKYKVMVTTNKGDSRLVADNLSTTKNNVVDCSNVALGLKNDEYITSVTFMFGTVKAGFAQVEQPQIFVKALATLPNGYQFVNKADVGGKYGREWIVGNSVCVTTIYKKPEPLPRTGY